MNNNLLSPKHHSATDWDFEYAHWSISTLQFVSAPSSLRLLRPTGGMAANNYLCKHDGTTQLSEGRIVTYLRQWHATLFFGFSFRNTAALGTANKDNSYYIQWAMGQTTWWLYEYLAGGIERSWSTSKETDANLTWHRYRLSWWLSWGALMVRLEKEKAGEWVQQGDDINVSDPLFGEEAIQRCGLFASYTNTLPGVYIDDTEIWEYEE